MAQYEVEVGAVFAEGRVARLAELGGWLPPAVLAARHAWVEVAVEFGSGADAAHRGFQSYPVPGADAAGCRGLGVQFDVGFGADLRRLGTREEHSLGSGNSNGGTTCSCKLLLMGH